MLLDKNVCVYINTFKTLNYYKSKGYDQTFLFDNLNILIKDLPYNSHKIIKCICHNCNSVNEIKYYNYNKNVNKYNVYCCKKCVGLKISATLKNTVIEKFSTINKISIKSLNKWELQYVNNIDEKNIIIDILDSNKNESYKNRSLKIKQTLFERYGVYNAYLIPEIFKNTLTKNSNLRSFINDKIISTCNNKYGGHPMTNKTVMTKFKNTMMKNHGVFFSNQSTIIFNKQQKSSLKRYDYKHLTYQGSYEFDFINICESLNIINDISECESLKYSFNDVNKIYYPDFYISKYNLIIEIKSSYYYLKYYEKNIAKMNRCKELGYNFIFIIDKKYELFLNIIKKGA